MIYSVWCMVYISLMLSAASGSELRSLGESIEGLHKAPAVWFKLVNQVVNSEDQGL